jgi:cysteine desulfurase family protein
VTERGAIYLDHGATSFPKAPGVVEAMRRFLEREAGNPGRGGHRLTLAASRAIEAARERIAAILGGDPERTLLGPGATFWINTVLASRLGPGARVVTSALEHNAVMRPLRHLESTRGVEISVVEGSSDLGVPTPEEIAVRVAEGPTALVVLIHASNVSGAVVPVGDIARSVAPVPVLVDAAQTAGSIPLDFASLGVAALACSGHKGLLGPPGVGVLLLEESFDVEPLVRGGTGSRSESEQMPDVLPERLEAGTANGIGIVGLGAACHWLAERTVAEIAAHEQRLVGQLASGLSGITGVRPRGWRADRPHTGILSFTVDGTDTGEVAAWLDRDRGICVRAGLHCAAAAHRRLGTFPSGTLRVGIGAFNTASDVEALVDGVGSAARRLRR